jgi:nucleoside-diphosphate kinase
MTRERSFVMVKPDGVQRGLIGAILGRFEQRGYQIVAAKLMTPSEELLRQHYADLSSKPFFEGMIQDMKAGPVFAIVIEGLNVVKNARRMLGETNPAESLPGSIRGDYSIDIGRNICHGSDSVDSANKEIALWFPEGVNSYSLTSSQWVYGN